MLGRIRTYLWLNRFWSHMLRAVFSKSGGKKSEPISPSNSCSLSVKLHFTVCSHARLRTGTQFNAQSWQLVGQKTSVCVCKPATGTQGCFLYLFIFCMMCVWGGGSTPEYIGHHQDMCPSFTSSYFTVSWFPSHPRQNRPHALPSSSILLVQLLNLSCLQSIHLQRSLWLLFICPHSSLSVSCGSVH